MLELLRNEKIKYIRIYTNPNAMSYSRLVSIDGNILFLKSLKALQDLYSPNWEVKKTFRLQVIN